jgi:hypothetical protein
MDSDLERDRLRTLDEYIELLDTQNAETVVHTIVERYQGLGDLNQSATPLQESPLWQLVQDIRRQAAVHSNIIERLKSGEDVSDVRKRFHDDLGLVSSDAIPNPRGAEAIAKAFKKVSGYGTTLVILVRDFGQQLLGEEELKIVGAEHTATLEVQLGVTGPSLTLGTSFTGARRQE